MPTWPGRHRRSWRGSGRTGPRSRRAPRAWPAIAPVLGLAVLACFGPTEPNVRLEGVQRIEPRDAWRGIYAEVEACLGRAGDFERVDWFSAVRILSRTEERSGAWLRPWGRPHGIALLTRQILGGGPELEATIRHEAIHEILQLGSHDSRIWCRCDDRDFLFPQCR